MTTRKFSVETAEEVLIELRRLINDHLIYAKTHVEHSTKTDQYKQASEAVDDLLDLLEQYGAEWDDSRVIRNM